MPDENGAAGQGGPSSATGSAAAAPPAGQGGSDQATSSTDGDGIWAQVLTLDADELVKRHPKLAGRIGTLSQKQAQALAAQQMNDYRQSEATRLAAEQQQRTRNERVRLAREDPDQLAQQVLTEEAQSERDQVEAQLWGRFEQHTKGQLQAQIDGIYQDPEIQDILANGDVETIRRLDYRQYPDFTKFSLGVARVLRDAHAGKLANDLAKGRTEAMMADQQSQRLRRDGANGADLGLSSGLAAGHIFTREELASMPMSEYKKHKAVIEKQAEEGLIQ